MPSVAELATVELEIRRCRKSFEYFVDNYCMMWMKEGGDPIPFHLWDFQRDAANKFQGKKKVIVLKARQMGLSWLASAYALWKVLFRKNFHAYYTSIGLKEVTEQMERIRFIYANLPTFLQEIAVLGGKGCKDNDTLIEFTNGSALHSTASGKSAGHGAAPGLFICDEWSRVEDAMKKWRAIKPSIGANCQVFIISTSDGFGNHFAEMWLGAKNGSNGFFPIFYSYKENPLYTPEYIEDQRRDFAGDMQGFMEAFPEKPEDAFLAASRSVFDHTRIREWMEYIRKEEMEPEIGFFTTDDNGKPKWNPDPAGKWMVWEHPKPGHRYAMGADVGLNITQKGDPSASAVLDCDTDEVVALYHDRIAPEYYGGVLQLGATYYNNAWLCVEVNIGSEIIIQELKATYQWLYLRPVRANIADLPTLVPGFYTTGTSKPRVITQFRKYFSDEERPLRIYSDRILDEMVTYEQDDKNRLGAISGAHDDCVMAVALAIEAKDTLPYQEEAGFEEPHYSWLSL